MKVNPVVLGIDPGVTGAFVITDGATLLESYEMPVAVNGKDKSVSFEKVHELLKHLQSEHGTDLHVFLERAVPMAMGSKHAFNYGRGFAALEIAIEILKYTVTYVEPSKWTKEMHEGVSADLKSKAKSIIAVKRLYPKLVEELPKNTKGALRDGPIDALLIAGYGLRRRNSKGEK